MYIGWNTGELAMDYQCLLQYAVFNFLIECFYCIFVVMKDAFHTLVCLCSQKVTLQLKCCMMHLIPLAKGKHVQWGVSFHFNWRLRATAVLSYVVVFAFVDLFISLYWVLPITNCLLFTLPLWLYGTSSQRLSSHWELVIIFRDEPNDCQGNKY